MRGLCSFRVHRGVCALPRVLQLSARHTAGRLLCPGGDQHMCAVFSKYPLKWSDLLNEQESFHCFRQFLIVP